MPPDLPQFIEPLRLAEEERRLQGKLDASLMERLQEVVLEPCGPVELDMAFSKDEKGVIRITGDYRVKVRLLCQRCLEAMELTLANPFNIGMVAADGDAGSTDEYEQVTLEGREIALAPLIEDEILLGLPMSPRHALPDCAAAAELLKRAPEKSSPFAVLKNLKPR